MLRCFLFACNIQTCSFYDITDPKTMLFFHNCNIFERIFYDIYLYALPEYIPLLYVSYILL